MPSGPCLARGIEVAQFFHDHDHYTDAIALRIHQALEKYLKGFLLKNGWTLQKTHDLINLASQAGNFGLDLRDDCEDALDRISECYRSRGPDSIERRRLPAMLRSPMYSQYGLCARGGKLMRTEQEMMDLILGVAARDERVRALRLRVSKR
jgi:HEPN domain-containing protein